MEKAGFGAKAKATLKAVLPEPLLFRLSAYDNYFYGEPELRLLRWISDASRTALDIGANVGTFTYFMRRYARHVFAYEPLPQLADRLARLLPDVTVRCAAVSDTAGRLTLRVPVWNGLPHHALASVVIAYGQWTEVREYNVPALRLDDEDTGDIGFIKIDVEQHELAVLRGAMAKIRRCRPAILTETNPLIYPKDLPDMFDFLVVESYRGFFKFGRTYLPFSQFCANIHADPKKFGGPEYIDNNVILLPEEKDADFLSAEIRS